MNSYTRFDGKAGLVKRDIVASSISKEEKIRLDPATAKLQADPSPIKESTDLPGTKAGNPRDTRSERTQTRLSHVPKLVFGTVEFLSTHPALAISRMIDEVINPLTKNRNRWVTIRQDNYWEFQEQVKEIVRKNAPKVKFYPEEFDG